jgi:hypothetical protein
MLKVAHNYIDVETYSVESDAPVAAGQHELKMDFTYEGGDQMGKGGTVTLSVDGSEVGSGTIPKTVPFKYSLSENQDVGTDTGTPVTYDYTPPFDFQGTLEEAVKTFASNSRRATSGGFWRRKARQKCGGLEGPNREVMDSHFPALFQPKRAMLV